MSVHGYQWAVACLCAASLFLGSSCRKSPQRPKHQELHFSLKSDPVSFDPRKCADHASSAVINLCFEGLTRLDAHSNPEMALASSVEVSEDKTVYLFHLREAYWSDGTKITASDFENTWKTLLDPAFPCEFANNLYIIKNARAAKTKGGSLGDIGIQSLDESRLRVELEHPVPYFLSSLACTYFFPCPAERASTLKRGEEERYVVSGPFRIKSFRSQDSIVFEKNPFYWDREQVRLERVTFSLVQDEGTELSMFERGELDWAGYPLSNLPTDAIRSLAKRKTLEEYPIAGTYFYTFNTKKFPFNNVHIRRAFALAMNREEIVTNVTEMDQMPATALIPGLVWGEKSSSYFKDNDATEARRSFNKGLQELGLSKSQFPKVSLSYNSLTGHHKIAQAIQQQWRAVLGIESTLENKEWKVFLDEVRQGEFQVARMGFLALAPDPIAFLDPYRYLSSSLNQSGWSNPTFSELLEEADFTQDPVERFALLKKAESILVHDMPIAPIYFYTGAYVKKPYVKGVILSELNILDLKRAYIDMDD